MVVLFGMVSIRTDFPPIFMPMSFSKPSKADIFTPLPGSISKSVTIGPGFTATTLQSFMLNSSKIAIN
jgi:hypothetical protein